MYCSQCGQPIQPQQAHCTVCGAPTGMGAGAGIPPAQMLRVSRHLQTLGILWTAYAGYTVLRWMLAVTFLHGFFGGGHGWPMGGPWMMGRIPFFGAWLLPFITALLVLRAILSLAVGIALLTRQPWGRTFAIVMAILTVLKLFTGTALAVYTLWVMFGPNAQQEYSQIAATSSANR
ncbi:MAG: zinc ribbon domain-containing protein [Acidobacteriaceae bacterium]